MLRPPDLVAHADPVGPVPGRHLDAPEPPPESLPGDVTATRAPPDWREVLRERTFRSLMSRDYRLYFTGQVISLTGTWMQSTAVMWLSYEQTQDPLWPPLMLMAQIGPSLLLGTWGGVLADRFPKRRVIIATQLAFMLNALVLTAFVASNHVGPYLLLTLQLTNGAIQGFDLPARLAYVPTLVPRRDLRNAVALNSMIFNAARAVGPAVAGALFLLADWFVRGGYASAESSTNLGAAWCTTLNGLSYIVVILALRSLSDPGNPDPARHGDDAGPLAGFRAVLADRKLGFYLAVAGGVSVFAWPALTLFPTYTRVALQQAVGEYSLLVSCLGAGALVAALGNATFGTEERQRAFLAGGAFAAVVALAALALATQPYQAGLGAALLGAGLVLQLSTAQSALQLRVPDHARGRVMALWPMMLSASTLVGQFAAGKAARNFDVRNVLWAMAAGTALAAVVSWRRGGDKT